MHLPAGRRVCLTAAGPTTPGSIVAPREVQASGKPCCCKRGLYPSNRGCSPTTPCAVNRRSRQANSRITHVPHVTKNAHPSLAATCAVVQNLQAETGAPTNWGPWGTAQTPNTPLAQNKHTQPCMHPSASMHRKLACAQYSTQRADMRRAQMRLRLHIRGHQKSPGAAQHDRVTGACTQLYTVC